MTDMGSNFLQFARIEGVTHENPYFVVRDQKIFYMFDVPHLFKSLRNNLLDRETVAVLHLLFLNMAASAWLGLAVMKGAALYFPFCMFLIL